MPSDAVSPLVSTAPAALVDLGERGLTAAEVAQRVAEGRTNATDSQTSRSTLQIIRANVITPFNGLLGVLFVAILFTGRWQNGLFGLVILANTAIGVVQELRAKHTLDKLAVLNAPHARAVRDGVASDIEVDEVVADDLLEVRSGDQLVADGVVTSSEGLEIDESLLTGESDPIAKAVGDDVRSGSIVVAGAGRFRATAVGAQAYVTTLTADAKRFTVVRSELVAGTNRLLRWISLVMVVVAPLLIWSQLNSEDNKTWQDALTGTVAALVGMVPEGLVLLTSLAFMIAVVTLARKQTLVQELPAVEVLARVDIVCLDKTGTLTHGDIVYDELVLADPDDEATASDVREALALSASGGDANATATALVAHFSESTWTRSGGVPFSSARKWSAISAGGHGTWVLGAPEMVFPAPVDEHSAPLLARAEEIASQGKRVLVLGHAPAAPAGDEGADAGLPPGLVARAVVVLAERVREDAGETLAYFAEQGVGLRVISGDSPRTVGAVATAVGLPGISDPSQAVDARTLPEDPEALAEILDHSVVFGRVTPQQKRAIVKALQRRGHVVAMTGDGVNDAMALKDADFGVAMGNGAAATRAVAQLVLLDGKFAHLPDVVAEGRRVIANIERAANLFLVKNVYSLALALIVVATAVAYPLAPIQLTLISSVTIGIPGFFLALGPNLRRYVPGFLQRVLKMSIPTGIVVAAAAFTGYQLIKVIEPGIDVAGARTVAALIVLIASLATLCVLARPLNGWKLGLVAAMAGAVVIIVSVPALATGIFLMEVTAQRLLVSGVIGLVAGFVIIVMGVRIVPRA